MKILAWWRDKLTEREQWLTACGAILAAALLVYVFAWSPWQQSLQTMQHRAVQLRQDLSWMRSAATQVHRLEKSQSGADSQHAQSLPTLIDRSATRLGLSEAIKTVEPQTERRASVRLDRVEFSKLLQWLSVLELSHGIVIVQAVIEASGSSGWVNARLVVQETPG